MSAQQVARLRQRAAHLRDFAARMERTPALKLGDRAGVDTWRGPKAHGCEADLHRYRQRIHAEADGLRTQAWLFEQRAAEIEAADAARLAAQGVV